MFSRRFYRIPVNFEAFLITEEASLPCVIENISEEGLNIVVRVKSSTVLNAGDFVKLQFNVPAGEEHNAVGKEIHLTCEIIWVRERADDGLSLGLRVTEENISYENLVRVLYIKKVGIL
jgi:hypothetical protein